MSIDILNYVDLTGIFDSVCEVEKEITREVGQILQQPFDAIAFPFMRYDNGSYPKWLNGLMDAKPDYFGTMEDSEPVNIKAELQLGKITEGYDGKLERQLQTWVPYTLAAFRATPRLQTEARMTVPLGLLSVKIKLFKTEMPGDIIGASFLLTCETFVTNFERD